MAHPIARRSGFTLVELLTVIAIIGILSALSFGLFQAAANGRNKSKARGEIQAISMACQSYRKMYGDFPCCASGNSDKFRKDLFDQLIGRTLIKNTTPGGTPQLLPYNDPSLPGGSTRQMRGFLSLGQVTTDNSSDFLASQEFRDPWGNPYDYRYRVLNGTYNTDWISPNFLFVSACSKFVPAANEGDILNSDEYWDPATTNNKNMTQSGIVPSSYFDQTSDSGPFRADNLVNWTN